MLKESFVQILIFSVFNEIFASYNTSNSQVSEFKIRYFLVNIWSKMIITFLSVWLAGFIVSSDMIIYDLPCLNLVFLIGRITSTALNNTS
jgi:hypothetical protein